MPDVPIEDINPFDPETFDYLYTHRAARPGFLAQGEALLEQSQRAAEVPYLHHGYGLNPRPDLLNRIEDQRGMDLRQLRLLAEYRRQRGEYPDLPPFDPYAPAPPISPLGREAGAANIPWRRGPKVSPKKPLPSEIEEGRKTGF